MMQSAGSLTLGYIGRQASPSKFRVRNSGEIRVRNSTGKIRDRLRGGLGTRHAQERREGKPLPCPASTTSASRRAPEAGQNPANLRV